MAEVCNTPRNMIQEKIVEKIEEEKKKMPEIELQPIQMNEKLQKEESIEPENSNSVVQENKQPESLKEKICETEENAQKLMIEISEEDQMRESHENEQTEASIQHRTFTANLKLKFSSFFSSIVDGFNKFIKLLKGKRVDVQEIPVKEENESPKDEQLITVVDGNVQK